MLNVNYVNGVIRNVVKRVKSNKKELDIIVAEDIKYHYKELTGVAMSDKQGDYIEELASNQGYAILSALKNIDVEKVSAPKTNKPKEIFKGINIGEMDSEYMKKYGDNTASKNQEDAIKMFVYNYEVKVSVTHLEKFRTASKCISSLAEGVRKGALKKRNISNISEFEVVQVNGFYQLAKKEVVANA